MWNEQHTVQGTRTCTESLLYDLRFRPGQNFFVGIQNDVTKGHVTFQLKKKKNKENDIKLWSLTRTTKQRITNPFKRFQHLPNIRSTKAKRMLEKCWTECSNGFNTIRLFREPKGNVVWMLKENLNQFKFDSTSFQHFLLFNNVERPVQTPPIFGWTKCWTHVDANVEKLIVPRLTSSLRG